MTGSQTERTTRVREQSQIPIRGLAQQLQDAILGGHPEYRARAIEDLQRSGCRPLVGRPEVPGPASVRRRSSPRRPQLRDGEGQARRA
jgi:hypothetical protein